MAKSVDKGKEFTEKNVDFAEGGDTPMFGKQQAGKENPGSTASDDQPGPGAKFAAGGTNKMFGYSPSVPAKSGITSAR